MYAMGVTDIDNVLMFLSTCRAMSQQENDVIMKLIIKGFNEMAKEADTEVTGGQTVINEWMIIGGCAMSCCKEENFIRPIHAQIDDVIILTKPLGTQISVLIHQWISIENSFQKIKDIITIEEIEEAYEKASSNMSRLNKNASLLMHKYGAHACTDITGFGLLGHATNLVKYQEEKVDFEIHTLPIIKNIRKIDKHLNNTFKLERGLSPETSGGLFICISKDKAIDFCNELEKLDNYSSWIIGNVVKGSNIAKILENFKVIEI